MVFFPILLFHTVCAFLGAAVVALSLTLAHPTAETVLYILFTLLMLVSYTAFGIKVIHTPKSFLQIWLLSILLLVLTYLDKTFATLVNLPFQPLTALLGLGDSALFFTALLPSSLFQLGAFLNRKEW